MGRVQAGLPPPGSHVRPDCLGQQWPQVCGKKEDWGRVDKEYDLLPGLGFLAIPTPPWGSSQRHPLC